MPTIRSKLGQKVAKRYNSLGKRSLLKRVDFTVRGATTKLGQKSPYDELGATVFSEAGSDPQEMRAVAGVIMNRVKERGVDISKVINAPMQFQGVKNPQYQVYFSSKKDAPSKAKYDEIQKIIKELQTGKFIDPTGGANFFAKSPTVPSYITDGQVLNNFGEHYFYKGRPDYRI